MQAAYNLAVGYEMLDSITTAVGWALKAQAEARIVDGVDKKRFDSPDPGRPPPTTSSQPFTSPN